MKKNFPIAVTAASIAAFAGASANAAPTGTAMSYSATGSVSVYGTTGPVNGTGTASFDDDGGLLGPDMLTISSSQVTQVFGGTGTITAISNIGGTIDGFGVFTSNGNTSGSLLSCAGSALICGPLGTLPSMSSGTSGFAFSVDINAGGSWGPEVSVNGPAVISLTTTLTPVPVPAAAWLFGSALLGLAGVTRKRKT